MRLFALVAAGAVALGLAVTSQASAVPLNGAAQAPATSQTLIEQVHGCHRAIAHGRAGWHAMSVRIAAAWRQADPSAARISVTGTMAAAAIRIASAWDR